MCIRDRPHIEATIFVDRTDPIVELIAVSSANEGVELFIDGSGSRDGIWGNNLQTLWYISMPDGSMNVIDSGGSQKLTHTFVPELSGTYTVRLDVFDSVGRTATQSVEIMIDNLPPEFYFEIDGLNVSESETWEIAFGAKHELSANVKDTNSDKLSLNYRWFVDQTLVLEQENFSTENMTPGIYNIRLEIEDNDGATFSDSFNLVIDANEFEDEDTRLELVATTLLILTFGGGLLYYFNYRKVPIGSELPKWKNKNTQNIADTEQENSDWN